MLIWCRNKLRTLIPALMVLFISGLLSLSCQHCLAKAATNINSQDMAGGPDRHADHMPMGPGEQHGGQQDPCTVFCDCEDSYVSADDNSSMNVAVNRVLSSLKIPCIHKYYLEFIPSDHRLFINGKPHIPDRSCYSPLERNCVLLI